MKSLFLWLGYDSLPIQQVESIKLNLVWGWATLVLLFLIFLPPLFWLYRLEDRPCDPSLKRGLMFLRVLLMGLVLFLLAGPRFSVTGMIPQKNKIAVLFDISRSMGIKEEGITRLERVRKAVQESQLVNALEKKTGISPSLFGFSGQVTPLARDEVSSFSLVANGDQTNISRAVSEIVGNLGSGNLLATILLTDGAHNHGENPKESLKNVSLPLYFLGSGKAGKTKDLSISLDKPPAIGFLNSKLRLRGELRKFQIASDSIVINLKENGKTIDSKNVKIDPQKNRANFSFNIPCSSEGQFSYSVDVPSFPDELTFENNQAGFLLKVVKERLKIFAVADQPNWDFSFLKAAVRSDPNSHYDGFYRIKDDRWVRIKDFEIVEIVQKPDFSEILDSDIILLRDVRADLIEPHLDGLTKKLEAGKLGVCIFMGKKSLQSLGYERLLKDLLPVYLREETLKRQSCNFILPAGPVQYAFFRLLDDPLENREFYKTLPKWESFFQYPHLKKGAEKLLLTTIDSPTGNYPALVSHHVGRGNVALFTGGPIWPMGFKLVPSGKGIKPYTAFIVNLLKWLANRREDAQVVLEIPSARGFIGQPSTIRVWVSDSKRQPVGSAQVSGRVEMKSGEPLKLSLLAASEKGCYETTFVPSQRGVVEIIVEARFQGELLGEAKSRFLVEVPTAEFDNPEVREDLMKQLASSSGGAYLPIERAAELAELIKPTPGHKRESKIVDVAENGYFLALLLLLPLIEWIVRRRKGFS